MKKAKKYFMAALGFLMVLSMVLPMVQPLVG
jgi:hypothetical protein